MDCIKDWPLLLKDEEAISLYFFKKICFSEMIDLSQENSVY